MEHVPASYEQVEGANLPSKELSAELERVEKIISTAANGWRPQLSLDEHQQVVRLVETAMLARERHAGGNDPVAKALNQLPELHQQAAMGVARMLARHDGPGSPNPFQQEALQRVYHSEQAFAFPAPVLSPAEAEKTYRGPIVRSDDRHVIQAVRDGGREQHIQHDRTALNSVRADLLKTGANVEIRYPMHRVGIVREWGAREKASLVSKGIEPRDFGKA
ncbi:KfrB domain-containing protein [Cupriavidus basilensis]|uniref:KfrB domain-containing protein n=1 Tax=Cupriavidus basilensis TaxID=68895 RepID=UPI0002FCA0A6|nr:hypothetical protein [Cupriavidus basilensis]